MKIYIIGEDGVAILLGDDEIEIEKDGTYTLVMDTIKNYENGASDLGDLEDGIVGDGFVDWLEEFEITNIKPGDDIRIRVDIYHEDADDDHDIPFATSTSEKVNSLFHGKSGNTVDIALGRHLQNLDTKRNAAMAIGTANQVADIDFGTESLWELAYKKMTFPGLISLPNTLKIYNGNGHTITDMRLVNQNDGNPNGGIFRTLDGVSVGNLDIINPFVEIKNAKVDAVDIVAGIISDSNIENVRIYNDDTKAVDDNNQRNGSGILFVTSKNSAKTGSIGGLAGSVT